MTNLDLARSYFLKVEKRLKALEVLFKEEDYSDVIRDAKEAIELAEMESEESGEIREREVFEVALGGKIIEDYPEDEPYPSCLIYGRTSENRPLHVVCAFAKDEETAIIITTYEPDPRRWIDFERRKT
jgi:hypothetical protein